MNNTLLKDRKLLYCDLCARLPYAVKVQMIDSSIPEDLQKTLLPQPLSLYKLDVMSYWSDGYRLPKLYKPYLFPLSSMTREQLDDFYKTIRPVIEDSLRESSEWRRRQEENGLPGEMPITLSSIKCETASVHWMLERHFDIYGLIPKDLAIDATGKNIY